MPASFCFVKPDGKNEILSDVDDKIAEFLGEKPDTKYAHFMDFVSDMGLGILMRMNGCSVDEIKFNSWLVDVSTKEPDRFDKIVQSNNGKLIPCLRKFLYQDYTFKAWR